MKYNPIYKHCMVCDLVQNGKEIYMPTDIYKEFYEQKHRRLTSGVYHTRCKIRYALFVSSGEETLFNTILQGIDKAEKSISLDQKVRNKHER